MNEQLKQVSKFTVDKYEVIRDKKCVMMVLLMNKVQNCIKICFIEKNIHIY